MPREIGRPRRCHRVAEAKGSGSPGWPGETRKCVRPRIDFALLFPPHGRLQILIYSVTLRGYNHPDEGTNIPPATVQDKAVSVLYFSRVTYKRDVPLMWRFE